MNLDFEKDLKISYDGGRSRMFRLLPEEGGKKPRKTVVRSHVSELRGRPECKG